MYQDQNGNYQYIDCLIPRNCARSILPSIYLERCQHNVPDINLECDESIDNWDDLSGGIYSQDRNEKLPGSNFHIGNLVDSQVILGNEFDCNNTEIVDDQFQTPMEILQNHFVNNLFSVCKDLDVSPPSIDEFTDSQESCNISEDDQQDITGDIFGSTSNVAQDGTINSTSQSYSETDMLQQLPVYDVSSRSSSPSIIEILSNPEHDFANYRSISPLIIRSPTPLSSRSSSPRMLHSQSPLEFLEHSFSELPLDDQNELTMYGDRYILRSYSPVTEATNDQQVPDVNIEFRQTVSDTIEFPSFRSYVRERTLSSCHDQVVPEYIEE